MESNNKIVEDSGEGSKPTGLLQKELDEATLKYKKARQLASGKLSDLYEEVEKAEENGTKDAEKLRKKYEREIGLLIKTELAAYKKAQTAWDNRQDTLFQKAQVRNVIQCCNALIIDEAHLAAVVTEEIGNQAKQAYYRLGLSVDANSIIELKGDIFGSGFIGSIEEAFNMLLDNGYITSEEKGYEYIIPNEVQSRGWTGTNFDWKKVKTFIKHKNDKSSRWLKVGGTKIGFTDDHSVFVAEQNKSLELVEKCTGDVKIGDIMAYDNGSNWNDLGQIEEDIYEILLNSSLNPEKIRIVVDISNITKEDLNVSYKNFWALKRTKYGPSLNLFQYIKLREKLPNPTLIYTERSNGITLNPYIKMSDLGYLLGFYIGDGWIDNNQVVFAVETSLIEQFLNYLNNLPGVNCRPKIRHMNKGSAEISINHCVLAALLKYYFKGAKCQDKRIPSSWILNWDEIDRRNLLAGMLDSDGHFSIRGTKKAYHYTTTSKKLVDDLMCLLRSLNVMSGVYVSKPSLGGIINGRRIVGKLDKYQVYFSAYALNGDNKGHKGKRTKFTHNFDDFTEAKVKQIIEEPISNYVYDLEMEGHPSFVVNGILCHNSATPFRTDNQEIRIEGTLGGKVCEVSASDLVERGFLVPPKIFVVNISTVEPGQTYHEVYNLNIVNCWERNFRIKQFAEGLKAKGVPTLILVERMEHGNILEGMIEDAVFVPGGDKGEIDPSDEEKNYRRRMLNAVENNEIILIATQWANVGVDAPKISGLILAGTSSSPVTTYQQVGRVLRCVGKNVEDSIKNGKPEAIIIDFASSHKNLRSHVNMRKKVYKNERAWKMYELK
jgi:intein/homing endonuclease